MSYIGPDGEDFSWVHNLVVDFDEDFINHLEDEDKGRVRCIQVAMENKNASDWDEEDFVGFEKSFSDAKYVSSLNILTPFEFQVMLHNNLERFIAHSLRESQCDIICIKEGHMDPANANNLPEATRDNIKDEFDNLLAEHGETTTLDVKNALRAKGFWVNQRDVSDTIWDIVQSSSSYTYQYENGHRVYTPLFGGGIPVGNITTLSSGSGNKVSLHKVNPKTFYKRAPTVGDWTIDTGTAAGPSEVFKNTTRNKARYEYAKKYGVKYVETCARKI